MPSTSHAPEALPVSAYRWTHEHIPPSPSNQVCGRWNACAERPGISNDLADGSHFVHDGLALLQWHQPLGPDPLTPVGRADSDVSGLLLADDEIAALCAPLKQPAAQVRFLRASGLTVIVRPNGRPAVVRSHAEAVLSGRLSATRIEPVERPAVAAAPHPNIEGFLQVIRGGKKNGPQKKVQPT
jgi:Domain of unknown function (DUF4224)